MNAETALERLREICLGFPEAVEAGGVGTPSFKVRGKIFAMRHSLHKVDRWSMWCKALPGAQAAIVASDPLRFFVPPYVGGKGWIGAYLDVSQDWGELRDLIEESYRMTAPKRLEAQLQHLALAAGGGVRTRTGLGQRGLRRGEPGQRHPKR